MLIKPVLSVLVAGAEVGDDDAVGFLKTCVEDCTAIDHAAAQVTGGSLKGVVTVMDATDGPFALRAH